MEVDPHTRVVMGLGKTKSGDLLLEAQTSRIKSNSCKTCKIIKNRTWIKFRYKNLAKVSNF